MSAMAQPYPDARFAPPVVAIVGASDSGKTTVAVGLIKELASRGRRVAAVKHCPHGHLAEPACVDTGRLYAAGALLSVAASPDRVTTVERRETDPPLDEIVDRSTGDIDLVVAEGYKNGDTPKILVQSVKALPITPSNVVAVVGHDADGLTVPRFTPDDWHGLATWVEERFLTREADTGGVRLTVDGVEIPLSRFPTDALSGMVLGFIRSLHDIPEKPRTVELTISSSTPGVRLDS